MSGLSRSRRRSRWNFAVQQVLPSPFPTPWHTTTLSTPWLPHKTTARRRPHNYDGGKRTCAAPRQSFPPPPSTPSTTPPDLPRQPAPLGPTPSHPRNAHHPIPPRQALRPHRRRGCLRHLPALLPPQPRHRLVQPRRPQPALACRGRADRRLRAHHPVVHEPHRVRART